jgi:hypothetical protein
MTDKPEEVKEDLIGKTKEEIVNIVKQSIDETNQRNLDLFVKQVNDSLVNIKNGKLNDARMFFIRDHVMYQDKNNTICSKFYETLENGCYLRFKVSLPYNLSFDSIHTILKDRFHTVRLGDNKEEIIFVIRLD